MRRLSDPITRAYKWRYLASLTVAVALVLGWQYFTSSPRYTIFTVLFLVAVLAAAVTITVRRMFWYLADEVIEEDAVLVARRNGAEVRVPFENIIDVCAVTTALREGISVQLRAKVSPFGTHIVFWPSGWKSVDGHEMDVIAAGLKSRIARGRAA